MDTFSTPPTDTSQEAHSTDAPANLCRKFEKTLELLEKAKDFAKSPYQTDAFQFAEIMMSSDKGMELLYGCAPTFDRVGLFYGGPWNDPSKLLAPLVAGCLNGKGVYPIIEILSDLRMLALAQGAAESQHTTAAAAREFLEEMMALNLDLVFPVKTEQSRIEESPHREAALRLFALLIKELGVASLNENVLEEIEAICAQRPLNTSSVEQIIKMAARIPTQEVDPSTAAKLGMYTAALQGPSRLSQTQPALADYRESLRSCTQEELEHEAKAFAEAMTNTGLVCPHHAVLFRHLCTKAKGLVSVALGLNDIGEAEFAQNEEQILQVCAVAILPATAQSLFGLARMVERGLFSRQEIQIGLSNLLDLDIQGQVKRRLLKHRTKKDGATANAILLAGTLSVLGHPLGVGQGQNPTCQAARGISLWAQHAPGYLITILISAARNGFIEMALEDTTFRSDQLSEAQQQMLDPTLDAVSTVLVPHLDYIYNQMMIKVSLRLEDSHKWVNPSLYGRWVPVGFASVFADKAQTTVTNYEDFVRRFYATHHPAYNDAHPLMYPNPVGLCITSGHGDHLGPHAISLQRIAPDPEGVLRVYFYNPNNEGRQDWGMGVKPSVTGHGEEPGESSLPFAQLLSRLYAFHYNPHAEGDAYAVPDQLVQEIEDAARGSWGRVFTWSDAPL